MDSYLEKYQTPYKYQKPVLVGSGMEGRFDSQSVDIPFVFWHREMYYMLYTGYDGIGYQSALATSKDLLNWEHKGVILKREEARSWDKVGCAATWMIKKSDNLYDRPELRKIKGKYWLVYHSYPSEGYEEGPAEIGLAWTEDEELLDWHRLEQPVFSWRDGAEWERGGLYKACIIQERGLWYMFYNAKDTQKRWIEQTGMAVSKDLFHWERYEDNPVLRVTPGAWDGRFVSDPYVVKDGELWLNFYFGYDQGHAMEGLAYSKDLRHWSKEKDPIIRNGEEADLDGRHAHKAAIVYEQDTLYHFYCAARVYQEGDLTKVYDEFRTIALATSNPIEAATGKKEADAKCP